MARPKLIGEFLANVEGLRRRALIVEEALAARDDAIRSAYEGGISAVDIAEAVGLSRQRVYQIIRAER
jgi:hypothetical protein